MIYVIKSLSELNRCQFMEKYLFTTYMLCMGERICGRLRRNIPNVTKVVWLSNDANHTKILFVYVYETRRGILVNVIRNGKKLK